MQSPDDAIAILHDSQRSEKDRNQAAHYLAENVTPSGIGALVAVLDDSDHGVRWAAAHALAQIGEPAMPALLHALMSPDTDLSLRESAHHVIAENSSPRVRSEGQALLKTLERRRPAEESMLEASRLLPMFR